MIKCWKHFLENPLRKQKKNSNERRQYNVNQFFFFFFLIQNVNINSNEKWAAVSTIVVNKIGFQKTIDKVFKANFYEISYHLFSKKVIGYFKHLAFCIFFILFSFILYKPPDYNQYSFQYKNTCL